MKKRIENVLKTRWAGQSIYYFEETDSTNTQAKNLKDAAHGTLVIADRQTAGRGRHGRTWESSSNENIYMTLRLKPNIPADKAPMLTLVMALSVVQAIEDVTGIKGNIKWPNDIVVNKKKICGILTEMIVDMTGIEDVVIGVGVNVNTKYFPEELKAAASLRTESGREFDRAEIIAGIVKRFEEYYEIFEKTLSLADLIDVYNARLINRNKEVRVLEPGQEYSGYALGIDELGQLLVQRETGEIEKIFAGEVSVRGLYGYV